MIENCTFCSRPHGPSTPRSAVVNEENKVAICEECVVIVLDALGEQLSVPSHVAADVLRFRAMKRHVDSVRAEKKLVEIDDPVTPTS